MELPSNELRRTYEVIVRPRHRVEGRGDAPRRVAGVKYAPMRVLVSDARDNRATLELQCREGKNRMIRRICDHLRLRVSRLRRVAFGALLAAEARPSAVVEARVPASLRQLVADEGRV